jgi:hypothetical protein
MTTGRINQVAFLFDAGTAQDLATPKKGVEDQGQAQQSCVSSENTRFGQTETKAPTPTILSASKSTRMPTWSMTSKQQSVACMVARGQVRGPANTQKGDGKEKGQRGTNSVKAGMQHKNP